MMCHVPINKTDRTLIEPLNRTLKDTERDAYLRPPDGVPKTRKPSSPITLNPEPVNPQTLNPKLSILEVPNS